MVNFTKVVVSNVWDKENDLPTIPMHNNPHIYIAYVAMILRNLGEDTSSIFNEYKVFWDRCQLQNGSFSRWPGGRGGDTSHDEIMGAAYMNKEAAQYLIEYLNKTDGQFSVEKQQTYNERRNVFRFLWLMPFMKACAEYRVSLFSQLTWGLYAVYNALTWKGDCSGTLKVWLCYDKMKKYPVSAVLGLFWKVWMEKRHKVTPKTVFSKYYLTECPVLADIVSNSF